MTLELLLKKGAQFLLLVYVSLHASYVSANTAGIGQKLPQFVMEDQNEKEVKSSTFNGKQVLLFLADRAGSKLTPNWTKSLEPLYRNKVEFVAIANVSSVPFFLKGFIRGKFKENYSYTVLMDWKGDLWDFYQCQDDVPNVVFIDNGGIARYKISGKGTEKEINQLRQNIDKLIR